MIVVVNELTKPGPMGFFILALIGKAGLTSLYELRDGVSPFVEVPALAIRAF